MAVQRLPGEGACHESSGVFFPAPADDGASQEIPLRSGEPVFPLSVSTPDFCMIFLFTPKFSS